MQHDARREDRTTELVARGLGAHHGGPRLDASDAHLWASEVESEQHAAALARLSSAHVRRHALPFRRRVVRAVDAR